MSDTPQPSNLKLLLIGNSSVGACYLPPTVVLIATQQVPLNRI